MFSNVWQLCSADPLIDTLDNTGADNPSLIAYEKDYKV